MTTVEQRKRYQETYKAKHPDWRETARKRCQAYRDRLKLRGPGWRKRTKTRREIQRDSQRRAKEKLATRARPDLCEVCGGPPIEGHALHFDHDHTTGKFRGWLCVRCNRALGLVKDSPEVLLKLALYLEQTRETV